MPAAVAIPAAIAGGSSLISGFLGSRAAGGAANIQSRAAQAAATGYQTAGDKAITGYQTAGQDALSAFQEGAGGANKTLADVFALISGQTQPWLNLGQQGATRLSELMQPGGRLDQQFQFGAGDFQTDPGYQFRLAEGQKALEASAAARGLLGTSGTLKGITQYGQNFASNEYQNAYERALGMFKTNQENTRANLKTLIDPSLNVLDQYGRAATNFGNQTAQNQFNLGELTGKTGLATAELTGKTGITIQQLVQEALMGGANAQAAGKVGSANAWQSALGGAAGAGLWYGSQKNANERAKQLGQVRYI